MKHKRVLVLGAPGSGKSKLSLMLGERTGLKVIHLDQEYWGPSWSPTELLDWRKKCFALAAGDSWIMDGNFGTTFKERWSRADLVIYLDPSPWISFFRQFLRFIGLGKKLGRPSKCPERFNGQLFWLTYKFRGAHGVLIEKKMREEFPHLDFIKMKSISELDSKLNSL